MLATNADHGEQLPEDYVFDTRPDRDAMDVAIANFFKPRGSGTGTSRRATRSPFTPARSRKGGPGGTFCPRRDGGRYVAAHGWPGPGLRPGRRRVAAAALQFGKSVPLSLSSSKSAPGLPAGRRPGLAGSGHGSGQAY